MATGTKRASSSHLPSIVDPLTGIVPWVSELEVERSDPDVFAVVAQSANLAAYGLPGPTSVVGSGAGLSFEAACWAAIGETAERYACRVLHPEDLTVGIFTELQRGSIQPIPPERWALFHECQYQSIPYAPFGPNSLIAWVKAESISRGKDRLVPASLVYMPYPRQFADPGEQIVAEAISTGTACASTRADALLRGICEVVERDSFMIVWRNRLPCPRIRIDGGSGLLDVFDKRFMRPWLRYDLWYTTLDLGIPCCFGVLRDERRDPPAMMVGGAAHPKPAQAVLKTLLELAQGLQWMVHAQRRETRVYEEFDDIRSFEDRMYLYAFGDLRHAFDFLDEGGGEIELSSIPAVTTKSSSASLNHCCDLLEQQGLEVLAIDMTTTDLEVCGLFVVKALIPECEPMEGDHRIPFLGGHRWREVPVRMGLRASPTTLDAINPYPHPYP